MIVVFTSINPAFISLLNIGNTLAFTVDVGLIALAMTLLMTSGEFDLSVGAVFGFSAVVMWTLFNTDIMSLPVAFLTALGIALFIGFVSGVFVTILAIPSFLVTLGMMQLVRGIDMRITYTNPVPVRNETFGIIFGPGNIGVVPILFLWAVAVAVIGHIVLRYTPFGRQVLATGGNRVAAGYSGINTRRVKVICFLITGLGAALAGMLWSGMMGTARYNFGEGAELAAIAAVILGGTSLFGGKGTILGTFVGALLIGTINNGLIIMGLDVSEQMMVAGAIIVLAVAFGKKPGL
jgi:ribose transport system permease protein